MINNFIVITDKAVIGKNVQIGYKQSFMTMFLKNDFLK